MTAPGVHLTAENLLLEHELVQSVAALEADGIEVIVLKGVPLTLRLHGRLDGRRMVDNDLLVRQDQVRRAYDLLVEQGYRPAHEGVRADVLDELHEVALSRTTTTGRAVTVDLHRALAVPTLFPVDEDLLWQHTQPYRLRVGEVRVLDPALTLLHLASHALQHRFGEPRILGDLAVAWRLWGDDMDLPALERLGRQTGLWHAFCAAGLLCQRRGLLGRAPVRPTARGRLLARLGARDRRVDRRFYALFGALVDLVAAGPRRTIATLRRDLLPSPAVLAAQGRPADGRPVALQHVSRLTASLRGALGLQQREWPDEADEVTPDPRGR